MASRRKKLKYSRALQPVADLPYRLKTRRDARGVCESLNEAVVLLQRAQEHLDPGSGIWRDINDFTKIEDLHT